MTETLVMIHGAFSGGWSFDRLADYFEARGYRCLTPDLRHHTPRGGSPPHPALGTTGMRDYLADLRELVDGLDTPPILVGHSMGGLLAQMLAAEGRAAAAILLAPSAPWGVLPSTPLEVVGAHALYLSGRFWEEPVLPSYKIAAEYALDRVDPALRRQVFARLVPESGRATFEILHWMQDVRRATFVFPRDIACPLYSLVGSHDKVNAPPTVRRVARRYRGRSDFDILPDMSHWLLGETHWRVLALAIEGWLQRTAGLRERARDAAMA